jgi:hypothetical protein
LYINMYVTFYDVFELCACRGAESWWGGRLACLDGSLARYVIYMRDMNVHVSV